jgi:hypothetical protein
MVTASNNGYSSASELRSSLNGGYLPTALFFRLKVGVRFTLRLAVYSQSVRLGAKPLKIHDQQIFQLSTCGYNPCVTSSLTRGWVCSIQLLLDLASAVILGSDSNGTHGHILLSQIRDSPQPGGPGSRMYIPQE